MSRLSAWRFRAHFEDFANAHGLARPGEKQMIASMTAWGQTRKWRRLPVRSVLPPTTDIRRSSEHVRLVPIVLQKSFSGDERNFLGLLMRFVCGDVRGLMVSHKIDHGPAHRRYRALQQWRRLKICFREIFGIVRFSTFATLSALLGPHATSDLSPECAPKRTSDHTEFMDSRPNSRDSARISPPRPRPT